jgi:RNA-directed DNA polymerase
VKRAGNLLEAIAERENLRLAAFKALRGKRAKADARNYLEGLETNLRQLGEQIRSNVVSLGRCRQFTIHDPKERLITAPCFEERVLHHAIMNVCEPILDRWLLPDTYACRRGKGRVACLLRAQAFARRFPFFLKLDIRKYFDSIDHATLKEQLARRFKDRRLLALLERIIDSSGVAPGKGVPIGSLTSQHFANYYLGWCDRFVKEHQRVPDYVRYMDDMVLWADSRSELRAALAAVTSFLAERLQLTVKPQPYLNRTGGGMDYLGVRLFPTHQRLNRRSRRRFRTKMRDLDESWQAGRIGELEAQQRSQALMAFTTTVGLKSWHFRRRLLEQGTGDGQGPGSRAAWRELEQQRRELPVGEPQQERAGQLEPEQRVPPGHSSNGD